MPGIQKNTEIHESFVAVAEPPPLPDSESQWKSMRDGWRKALVEKSFRGWPDISEPPAIKEAWSVERDGLRFAAYDFDSQPHVPLRLYVMRRAGVEKSDLVVLNVLDEQSWTEFLAAARVGFEQELKDETLPEPDQEAWEAERRMHENFKWAMAYVAPRGIGPTAWDQSDRKQTQHRRRFALLGQTLDGMRVWDVRRAVQAIRSLKGFRKTPLWLQGHRRMAGVTLYASLFEPAITRLDLHELPKSHRDGPFLLNVRKTLDMPQAVAMAAEHTRVVIYQDGKQGWEYAAETAKRLGWSEKQLQIRSSSPPDENWCPLNWFSIVADRGDVHGLPSNEHVDGVEVQAFAVRLCADRRWRPLCAVGPAWFRATVALRRRPYFASCSTPPGGSSCPPSFTTMQKWR